MYLILLTPIIAGAIAQGLKFAIKKNEQKFSFKNLLAYSGMPSGHSAIVVSLATIMGLERNFSSPEFAISFVLAIVVIRDALGIRRYLGKHGEVLNVLVKDLGEDQLIDKSYPFLLEKIGHTPLQVLVGSLIGLIVAILGFIFF